MFWLIEEKEQLEQFSAQGFKEVFLEVIPHNFNTHPILDSVSYCMYDPLPRVKAICYALTIVKLYYWVTTR